MEIVNRVASSSLVTLDLEEYYHRGERVLFDIKDWLFHELVLKEKEFRTYVKEHDWEQYNDKNVAIVCSADAIVPVWAFMLVATRLKNAHHIVMGSLEALEQSLFQEALSKINIRDFEGGKVVIKGCGELPVPDSAYIELTRLLTPVVSSIMYGEPCSTVPIYKAPKKK
ncbi:DUF2480 family protein [Fulvivirga sp. M361]|uniref:DUF2480 family protein n=1 Tax=Fulvivirga sp. M361 TaxID=2594266 RepID=UPI00117A1D6D|nr:DUF2480 family protein [Fulvivirga sp. M361]TRX62520.1 DUF2480 family protein [Fulvivirga sp. M361]